MNYDDMLRVYQPGIRVKPIASPFSHAGSELRARVLDEMAAESVAANGFAYPVLAVYSLPHGPMAASLYREAGNGELIAEFPDRINAAFPLRMLYIELSTLRSCQGILTKPLWEKAYRRWRRQLIGVLSLPRPIRRNGSSTSSFIDISG